MKKILILLAHPTLERSRINRAMLRAIDNIPEITIHDLYETYPDFTINVPFEQRLAAEHDVIIFQHPLYWYSCPALLKEWQDLVLTEEWAYGFDATGLQNKQFMLAITCGGPEHSYSSDGYNRYPIDELLKPFEQTAHLCGMKYAAPFVFYGAGDTSEQHVFNNAEQYRDRIIELGSAN